MALRAPEEIRVFPVPPAQLARWVPEADLALTGLRARKAPAVPRVTKELVDLKAASARWARGACPAPEAFSALKVPLALKVRLVHREVKA